MKKLSLFVSIVLLLACFMGVACFADAYEYYPDEDGLYTVSYEGEAANEYIIIVLKGIFDETNFVEAWDRAPDEDILYYEQLASDEDGIVTFGPFAPTAYYDATIIMGGTSEEFVQPVIVGYLKTAGVTNVASVEIYGVEESYALEGVDGEDTVIEVDARLVDSFGYPAITSEKAIISISGNTDGVSVDTQNATVTIDKCAPEGEFVITAVYGDYFDSVTVEKLHDDKGAYSVVAYTNTVTKKPVTEYTVDFAEGEESVRLFLYSQSFDKYASAVVEERKAYVDGEENESATVFDFTSVGVYEIKLVSENNADVYTVVTVTVRAIPAYEENAAALYELIKKCDDELELIGVEKFVSLNNGKDVYSEYTWTTSARKTAFEASLASAKEAMESYNAGETDDASLASVVASLTAAYNTYTSSFKTGVRVDIEAISITQQNIRMPITSNKIALKTVIEPLANTDTVTWASSDPETVYVDEEGKLTAKENGTVTITATTSTGLTAFTTVTAYTKITSLELAESKKTITYGDEPYVVKIQALPANQSEILTWVSSKPDVATVDQSGRVTAMRKAGTTEITVIPENDVSLSKTCVVTVKLPDWETVSAPVASLAQGNVYKGQELELTTLTDTAKIYYTLDGSVPTAQSRPYVAPIAINYDVTVKAIAIADRMYDSEVVSYTYTVVSPEISIGNVTVCTGNSASANVSIVNNPGINTMSFEISLPEGVELTAEQGEALSTLNLTVSEKADNVYLLKWEGEADDNTAGVAAKLTFTASATAVKDTYDLAISELSAVNADGKACLIDVVNGTLTVSDVKMGDVNNDTRVNIQDVILLAQYCAGWESAKEKAVLAAADVNADTRVNIQDVIRLAQFCAGWSVTLG